MVEKCGKLFWVCDICDMFFNTSIRFAPFEWAQKNKKYCRTKKKECHPPPKKKKKGGGNKTWGSQIFWGPWSNPPLDKFRNTLFFVRMFLIFILFCSSFFCVFWFDILVSALQSSPFFGWNILIVFKEFLLLNDTGYVHIEIDPFTVSTSRFSDKDPTAHKQWLAFGVDFARLRGASQLIIVSSRNPWFFKLGKGSELKIGNADLMGSSASLFSLFSKVSIECEALHSKLQSFCVMLLCGRSISHSQCDFQVFVCQSESLVHFKMWWLDVQVWYSKWKQCAATFSEWGFSCDVTHVHTLLCLLLFSQISVFNCRSEDIRSDTLSRAAACGFFLEFGEALSRKTRNKESEMFRTQNKLHWKIETAQKYRKMMKKIESNAADHPGAGLTHTQTCGFCCCDAVRFKRGSNTQHAPAVNLLPLSRLARAAVLQFPVWRRWPKCRWGTTAFPDSPNLDVPPHWTKFLSSRS